MRCRPNAPQQLRSLRPLRLQACSLVFLRCFKRLQETLHIHQTGPKIGPAKKIENNMSHNSTPGAVTHKGTGQGACCFGGSTCPVSSSASTCFLWKLLSLQSIKARSNDVNCNETRYAPLYVCGSKKQKKCCTVDLMCHGNMS